MATAPSLTDRLAVDLKEAMRARDAAKVTCLRQVRALLQRQVDAAPPTAGGRGELDDGQVVAVVRQYIKSLRRGIEELAAAGPRSQPLRDTYAAECRLLTAYLPPPLEGDRLRQAATALAGQLQLRGGRDRGRLLGELMRAHPGQVDAATARPILAEVLPDAH